MSCWVIVPIKTRSECKSRLRNAMQPPARRRLAQEMLEHVLAQASHSDLVDKVLVVSPERDRLSRYVLLLQDRGKDLNAALDMGRALAISRGASELTILAADLPMVTTSEIDSLVAAGRQSEVAIAPDRAGIGTNGLFLAKPQNFAFQFGTGSFARHEAEAIRRGSRPTRCILPGLAADVDTGDDLQHWLAVGHPFNAQHSAEVPPWSR